MNTSNFCKKKICSTKIGSSTTDALNLIDEVTQSIERELNLGVYTVNSIPALNKSFSDVVIPRAENPIQRQIRLYGETEFYTAVIAVNAYFERPEIAEILDQYPRVRERVEISPISPIEISAFIDQYQYIPRTLIDQARIFSTKLIRELENFYTDNISSSVIGGFCSLMPNIFAAIDTFFTALSDVQNFINRVRDFAANFQANLRNLIETIRNQILETITQVVDNIRNIIENFTVENLISEVRTFIEDRILARFYELREDILGFFEEFNIENIRERIRGIIDYASRVFQNPTLEEIQYLIYRFCNLASFIENTFNDLLNPLRDFRNGLENAIDTIRGRSELNSGRSTRAGGIRLPPEERERRADNAPRPNPATPDEPAWGPLNLNIIPPTAEEIAGVTPWNEGNGDARITFARNGSFFEVGNCARHSPGRAGWENVNITVRVMIMRVQARFGRRLTMNSAFRPREYNQCLRDNGVNAALNSLHINGQALDVSWGGFNTSSMEEFIAIAIEEGFRGIGRYPGSAGNFVHVDVGQRREW